ncbi:MAG: orotidine-5'-phosphate decarboxylase [Patescibacteria group bacterium]
MDPNQRIIVAVDTDSITEAKGIVADLAPFVGGFKIGLQFIYAMLVKAASGEKVAGLDELFALTQGKLFIDGKLNDIPNTVAGAAKAIASLNPFAFNIHASSGLQAMQAAAQNKGNAFLWAVTVLTSLGEDDCNVIFGASPKEKVLELARLAKTAGADGIICSPQELEILVGDSELEAMEFITPGIRPLWSVTGDQQRIMTPAKAIEVGATRMVIGRPITNPEGISRVDAVKRILKEIESVGTA